MSKSFSILILLGIFTEALCAPRSYYNRSQSQANAPSGRERRTRESPPRLEHRPYFFNIQFNPLPLLVGQADIGIDFAVGPSLTIGPTGNYWNKNEGGNYFINGWGIGLRSNLYLSNYRLMDSWYLAPSLSYNVVKVSSNAGKFDGTIMMGTLLLGYHWVWPTGFNLRVGMGGSYSDGKLKRDYKIFAFSTATGVDLAGEFSIGYAF